jgi:hypothetical protein
MFEVGWVPDTSLNPESDSESLPHYDAELRFWTTFEQHGFVLAAGEYPLMSHVCEEERLGRAASAVGWSG